MLQDVLQSLNNWFCMKTVAATFTVVDGGIDVDGLQSGQYFRITGSVFNDGLHQYPATDLTDETFVGEVWFLAIPKQVIDLTAEIDTWCKEHPASIYDSESFGGYSYHTAKDGNGNIAGWQDVFRKRLNRWRKIA